MPRNTPLTKIQAVERYTDSIRLEGDTFDEVKEIALDYVKHNSQFTFVHPFDDLEVAAGQGTMGLEIVNHPDLNPDGPDYALIPVGGGGLITGVATILKNRWSKIRIVGVEPQNIPSLSDALRRGKPVKTEGKQTMADGVAVAEVGHTVFPFIKELVDEVWTVSEESIAKAIVRHMEDSRVIVEGAGACPLGALFEKHVSDPGVIQGKRLLLIVSGGNLDILMLGKLVQRGLLLENRISVFQFLVPDVPGQLARITKDVGDLRVNILDLHHARSGRRLPIGSAFVNVTLETRDAAHRDGLLTTLKNKGHDVWVLDD